MAKNRQATYSQALSELENIVGEIESEKMDVDLLAEKVKRAASLIKFCRTRLRSTEEEVRKVIAQMDGKEESAESVITDDNEPEQ